MPQSKRLERPKEAQVSASLRQAVMIAHGGACRYCGEHAANHVDHINPVARGGLANIKNLILACDTCNLAKSSKLLVGSELERITRLAAESEIFIKALTRRDKSTWGAYVERFTSSGREFKCVHAYFPVIETWSAFVTLIEIGDKPQIWASARDGLDGAMAADAARRIMADNLLYKATRMQRTIKAAIRRFGVNPRHYATS